MSTTPVDIDSGRPPYFKPQIDPVTGEDVASDEPMPDNALLDSMEESK